MKPNGVVFAAVPPGAIPNDMRAGLGENNVVLQLGVVFIAAGTVGDQHGDFTGGAFAVGILYPEFIRVPVKILGFPNHETVLSLQQGTLLLGLCLHEEKPQGSCRCQGAPGDQTLPYVDNAFGNPMFFHSIVWLRVGLVFNAISDRAKRYQACLLCARRKTSRDCC